MVYLLKEATKFSNFLFGNKVFIASRVTTYVSLQRRALKNFEMDVLLQRRAQKCMKHVRDVCGSSRHTKIIIYYSFNHPTSTKWRKRLQEHVRNLRFARVLDIRPARSDERAAKALIRNFRFATVLNVRRARSDERVAKACKKFAFGYSFGRPTRTKWRKGCKITQEIGVSLQFGTSDEHKMMVAKSQEIYVCGHLTFTFCVKGCLGDTRICVSLQFWTPDEHEVTRGLSPAALRRTYPAQKKNRFLQRGSIFEEQPFSAVFLSSLSQQPFSAAFLSSFSRQPFSAAFLSSLSQQLWQAAFLSSFSHQPFSAAFLSSLSQQLFSATFLSSLSQQLFSAAFLRSFSQQPFSAAFLTHHLAAVRGWWSAINIILLWSGVGGQLFTSSCGG